MRTKALLLTAAIGAAGIATSMAQVYSVNAVGYVNVTIPIVGNPTYAILANPLNGTNNNIATILPVVPEGTLLSRFDSVNGFMNPETYFGLPGFVWDPGTTDLKPGEAFFIVLPPTAPQPTTITFVGEVPTGNLTNTVPSGFSLQASQVPQTGTLQTQLGFQPVSGDLIYKWNNALTPPGYDIYTYFGLPGFMWDPGEPTIDVGTGFFVLNSSGSSYKWGRSFTVN